MVLVTAGAFAQKNQEEPAKNEGLLEQILSKQGFASGIEGTKFFINGGVGLEIPILTLYADHNMPPLSVSVDYVLPSTALSLGGKLAFSTVKYSGAAIDGCVNVDIGLRLAIHSNLLAAIENLDISALALLGFDFATGDTYKTLKNLPFVIAKNFDGFYIGLGLGGRYFFTKNIGAFLEVDVKAIMKYSVGASAGLALKF